MTFTDLFVTQTVLSSSERARKDMTRAIKPECEMLTYDCFCKMAKLVIKSHDKHQPCHMTRGNLTLKNKKTALFESQRAEVGARFRVFQFLFSVLVNLACYLHLREK